VYFLCRISYLKGLDSSVNPFNLGLCRNVATFFCYFQPYDWTVVYSKSKQSEPSGLVHDEYLPDVGDESHETESD